MFSLGSVCFVRETHVVILPLPVLQSPCPAVECGAADMEYPLLNKFKVIIRTFLAAIQAKIKQCRKC